MQSADRTGWLTISEPQLLSQDELEIQNIYNYLQLVDISPLVSDHARGLFYKILPPSVRGAIRAHTVCRRWALSRIAAPGIGKNTRQARIELFLQAIEICRSRSLQRDDDPHSPTVRSFVETVLTSAILSPESRLYQRVWQDVAQTRDAPLDQFEPLIRHRAPPAKPGRKPTVDFGWMLERIIEILSLPDTLSDETSTPGLVNFEKRR